MTPVERQACEQQAERALRRGDFGEALARLRALALAFPDEPALTARLSELEASLGPGEAQAPPTLSTAPSGVSRSPMHHAEALAARGDFAGAIATYRQLLADNPDLELVRERIDELVQLAQARATPRRSVSREQLLEHLLGRIATRKRP